MTGGFFGGSCCCRRMAFDGRSDAAGGHGAHRPASEKICRKVLAKPSRPVDAQARRTARDRRCCRRLHGRRVVRLYPDLGDFRRDLRAAAPVETATARLARGSANARATSPPCGHWPRNCVADSLLAWRCRRREGRREPPAGWPNECWQLLPLTLSAAIRQRCSKLTQSPASPAAAVGAAWAVCQQTGARLAAPVARIAQGAAADLRIARETDAALAGARSSAHLLAALPIAGVVLGAISGTKSVHVLLSTSVGQLCLLLGVSLDLAGLAWLDRLAAAGSA